MVYTKSKRRTRANKTRKIAKKNGLTVMSFNVELFLNVYNFIIVDDMIQTAKINTSKIKRFKNLFKNIDVSCLQETYISGHDIYNQTPLRIFDKKLRHLELRDICRSHILDWDKAVYLYGDPSYLANAIYVSNKLETLPNDSNIPHKINDRGLERCFSMTTVQFNGKPIKIVSVHLVGGRFDDIEAIQDESYYTEKINQIKQVVSNNPDIICGDFNTKFRTPEIIDNTNKYFNNILEKIDEHIISENTRKQYEARWDKWIYMDSIHEYLTQNGYKSVYYSDSGDLQIHIADTTAFGGIVDMIYYKSDTLTIKPNSVEVVGDGIVMEKNFSQIYKPVLSDHFPVKATFELVL